MSRQLYRTVSGLLRADEGLYQTRPSVLEVDDFEHNSMTVWESDGGGDWSIQSDNVLVGDYAGQLANTQRVWNHPAWNGIEYYPQEGDLWEYYFRLDDHGGQVRVYIARSDADGFESSDGYQFHLYNDGTYRLRDSDGTDIASDFSTTFNLHTWYRIRHWWLHPDYNVDHRIQLYDMDAGDEVQVISGDNDTVERDTGGIMMYTNSGATVQFDRMQILERTQ